MSFSKKGNYEVVLTYYLSEYDIILGLQKPNFQNDMVEQLLILKYYKNR